MEVNTSSSKTSLDLIFGYWVWVILLLVEILAGSACNILAILVLCRKKRKSASTIYLTALAAVDFLALIIPVSLFWARNVLDEDIWVMSNTVCKIFDFSFSLMKDASAWILMVLSVERVIAAVDPYRYRRLCTLTLAGSVVIVTVILGFAFSVSASVIVPRYMYGNNTTGVCWVDIVYKFAEMRNWLIVTFVKSSILPGTVMLISYTVISRSVYRRFVHRRERGGPSTISAAPTSTKKMLAQAKLLVALSLVFIGITAPVYIYAATVYFGVNHSAMKMSKDPVFSALVTLSTLNHAVNFWFYFYTAPTSRKELKHFLRQLKASIFKYNHVELGQNEEAV